MADTINLCEYEEGKLVGSLTLAYNVIIACVQVLTSLWKVISNGKPKDSKLHSNCLILISQPLQFHILPTENQRSNEMILSSPLTANIFA